MYAYAVQGRATHVCDCKIKKGAVLPYVPSLNLATGKAGVSYCTGTCTCGEAQSHLCMLHHCRHCYDRVKTTPVMAQMRKEPRITDFLSATSGSVCKSREGGVSPAHEKQSKC